MTAGPELDWETMALVGRIARAHGIRGEMLVNPETDFVHERFRVGAVFYTFRAASLETIRVEAARLHLGRPLLKLSGVDTMSQAETLAGLELRVPLDELRRLPAGHYYRHELGGCRVETVDGAIVGLVDRVEGTAVTSRLVISAGAGREILVPLAEEICVVIDPGARRIVIRPTPGLLDLNEPQGRRGS